MLMQMRAELKSDIPRIVLGSEAEIEAVIERSINRIETGAKERSRVDTGNMRAGWEARMQGHLEGVVFNLVNYTIYNELGTIFMSAQPMLVPAVEEEKQKFLTDMTTVYEVRPI
jgi:HK97 gp10 family phage protein